jgi:hypothetical protein
MLEQVPELRGPAVEGLPLLEPLPEREHLTPGLLVACEDEQLLWRRLAAALSADDREVVVEVALVFGELG